METMTENADKRFYWSTRPDAHPNPHRSITWEQFQDLVVEMESDDLDAVILYENGTRHVFEGGSMYDICIQIEQDFTDILDATVVIEYDHDCGGCCNNNPNQSFVLKKENKMETMTEIVDKQTNKGFVKKPLIDRLMNRLGITRPLGNDLRQALTCERHDVPHPQDPDTTVKEIWLQFERDFYIEPATHVRATTFLDVVRHRVRYCGGSSYYGRNETTGQAFLIITNTNS